METNTILILEDDEGLNQGIILALRNGKFKFLPSYTMQEARRLWREEEIDLAILDINLPDGNGYDLLTDIRKTSNIPVIMLTANDLEMDEVKGLMMGADDYVTKPFSLMVLRARVERALSRTVQSVAAVYQGGPYWFDFDNMCFKRDGHEIVLSKSEQKVLRLLTGRPGQTITRDTLMDRVWSGEAEFVDENALSVTVSRLRKKLEDARENTRIKTVYGIGYTWEEN